MKRDSEDQTDTVLGGIECEQGSPSRLGDTAGERPARQGTDACDVSLQRGSTLHFLFAGFRSGLQVLDKSAGKGLLHVQQR